MTSLIVKFVCTTNITKEADSLLPVACITFEERWTVNIFENEKCLYETNGSDNHGRYTKENLTRLSGVQRHEELKAALEEYRNNSPTILFEEALVATFE